MSTITHLPEPTSSKARLGAEIRAKLARQNLNQGSLAAALGMTQSQVSKRLRGVIALNVDELDAVAAFLRTTPDRLMRDAWAPWDSNPQPAGYSAPVTSLADYRTNHTSPAA